MAAGLSRRRACALLGLGRRHFVPPAGPARQALADAPVEAALRAAIARHPGWGIRKYHHYLRRQAEQAATAAAATAAAATAAAATAAATTAAATTAAAATAPIRRVNHKRLWRIYCAAGLQLPRRPKKRLPARTRLALAVPPQPTVCWSMDFTSDALTDGRRFRTFTLVDDFHRAALALEVDFSLPAARVIRTLTRLIERHGKPTRLRCDNGPEFIATTLQDWCAEQHITLAWIQPGKPTQNAYIERFNGTYRRELLDTTAFATLRQARELSEQWQHDYNYERPHEALDNLTPMQFLAQHRAKAST